MSAYHARAAYYETLAVEFGKCRAYESVRFYQAVAQRCREMAARGIAA